MPVAVVTGATSGVGRALVEAFVGKGWDVAGLARRGDALGELAAALGDRFMPVTADVGRADQVERAFADVRARHGRVDLLVNNAAVFKMAPFETMTAADVDAIIDTNLKGTILCTMAALPLLTSGSARVVNIGSVAGTHGIRHQALYCASKFGVTGFADALNQELVQRGVTMTTVCPGGIATPLWDPATNPYPGPPGTLLQEGDLVSLVEYIADLPRHVLLKQLILFPTNEWH